jgi:hypothetical protein
MQAARHGIAQAKGNADWLAGKLTALNGASIPRHSRARPPRLVGRCQGQRRRCRLHPKSLPSFLTGRPSLFSGLRETFRAINSQLEERSRIDLTR